MSESRVSVQEKPKLLYEPTPLELQLANGETSGLRRIQGSPRIWHVKLEGGAGIFKSRKYKDKIISDTQNERAAYLISRIVGFNFVPATVLRNIGGQDGALQEYIPGSKFLHEVEQTPKIKEGLYKYWIFGHMLRNMDRHDENLLIKDDSVISIDHEGSFDPDYSDPSYFDQFRQYYGQASPDYLIQLLKLFDSDNLRQELLRNSLHELLSTDDIDITMRRIGEIGKILLKNGGISRKDELAIS